MIRLCILSCVGYINFFIKLLESCGNCWKLRSRCAIDFSGNCVPAVKKVRELGSRAFPLKLSPDGVHSIMSGMQPLDCVTPKTWVDTKNCAFALPNNQDTVNLCSSGSHLEIQDGVYFITL